MNYVDQIKDRNGNVVDIHDKRLEVTAADAGKLISVNENGDLSLIMPSYGTKLYQHVISQPGHNRIPVVFVSVKSEPITTVNEWIVALTYSFGFNYYGDEVPAFDYNMAHTQIKMTYFDVNTGTIKLAEGDFTTDSEHPLVDVVTEL